MSNNKRKQKEPTWKIHFEDAGQLRNIVDVIATILPRACFTVLKEGGENFLTATSLELGMSSAIHARLRLEDVTFPSDETQSFEFSVDCKSVSSALDISSYSHLALVMEGFDEDCVVKLTVVDGDSGAQEVSTTLSTFVVEQSHGLDDMDFDMILELDVKTLRDMVKQAKNAQTEKMRLQVYLRDNPDASKNKVSIIVFSVKGFGYEHTVKFCAETVNDGSGNTVARAAPDGTVSMVNTDDLTAVYDNFFTVKMIEGFLKHLKCSVLIGKIQQHKPLLLHYPLTGTCDEKDSHIRYLICACTDGE